MEEKKFGSFRTSDGHVWIVEIPPEKPGWTPEQHKLARKSILLANILIVLLAAGLVTYIIFVLTGE
jgi:hypothetical protein